MRLCLPRACEQPSEYNEAKQLLAVYLLVLVIGLISVPIIHLQTEPLPAFMLKAIAILMATTSSNLVLFLPKVLVIRGFNLGSFGDVRRSQIVPGTATMPHGSSRSEAGKLQSKSVLSIAPAGHTADDVIEDLQQENRELRERCNDLSDQVAALKGELVGLRGEEERVGARTRTSF